MELDAKFVYWLAAWINMAFVVAFAARGFQRVKARAYATHKRTMLIASFLVGGFVVSYVFKVVLLGKEALETWEPAFRTVLYVHETCVLAMVVGGAIALWKGLRTGLNRLATEGAPATEDAVAFSRAATLHRRAGLTALVASVAGLVTATIVLYGMYHRL